MPLLSIIVPVYNNERYLRKCIDSIINQTLQDIEIIIVDDGSTDNSSNICDEYLIRNHRIKVIHKENEGSTIARLKGLSIMSGEYVGFVDSDDWIEKDTYEKMILAMKRDTYTDICIGGYICDYGNKRINPFEVKQENVLNKEEAQITMFEGKTFNWSLCDKIYKSELFSEIKKWNEDIVYGEDSLANWQLFCKANRVIYVPVYGYHYNLANSDSMTHQAFDKKRLTYIDVYDMILTEIPLKQKSLQYAVSLLLIKIAIDYLYRMISSKQNYEKEYEQYQAIFLKYNTLFAYELTIFEKRVSEILTKSYKEARAEMQKRKEQTVSMIHKNEYGFEKKYIYGIGTIAAETADAMDAQFCEYDGFVVTERNEISTFHNKKVYSFAEILPYEKNKIMFILGMNKKNSNEIISMFQKMKLTNYVNTGVYSLRY